MNRKAQEELVGFVLIVVLVSIIFVVILGLLIRKPTSSSENLEVSQFLESMVRYTTKCALGYEPNYVSIGELLGQCYDAKTCTSGKKACDVLKEELDNVIGSSWLISEEGYYSGYELEVVYAHGTESESIVEVSGGTCNSFRGADTFLEHSGGVITSTLKICTKS